MFNRNRLNFLYLFALLALVGCNLFIDQFPTRLPAETDQGANSLGVLMNGAAWVGTFNKNLRNEPYTFIEIQPESEKTTWLYMKARLRNADNKHPFRLEISASFDTLYPGLTIHQSDTSMYGYPLMYVSMRSASSPSSIQNVFDGALTIRSYNFDSLQGKIFVSGVLWFAGETVSGDTLQVESGRFDFGKDYLRLQ